MLSLACYANPLHSQFAEQVYVDGWFVESNISHAGVVPAIFRVLWSAGHDSPFQTLAPVGNFVAGFESMFARSSSWSIALKGQERTEINRLPCWPCAIVSTIMWFALGAGCALTSTSALLGRRCAAVAAVRLSVGVFTALSWIVVLARLQNSDSRGWAEMTFPAWRGAITSTLLAPSVIFTILPKQMFATIILSTCVHLALVCVAMLQEAGLDSFESNGLLLLLLRSHEVCVCVGCLALVVARIAQQKQAYRLALESVQEAKDRLDQVWLNTLVLLGTQAPDTLESLCKIAQQAGQGASRKPVQRNSQLPSPSEPDDAIPRVFLWDNIRRMANGDDSSSPARPRAGNGPLVQSLDQLYAQGRLCARLLQTRAQTLAFECKGMFPITAMKPTKYDESALYVLWEETKEDEEMLHSIQWTALKPMEKAKSKVQDHYNGDASRLLDICRETIVFQEVEDITRCLHAVVRDREVVVERIKNTLTMRCASEHASGYRGVLLNLRIDTPASRALGVAGIQNLRRAADARDRATVHHYMPQFPCGLSHPFAGSNRRSKRGEGWQSFLGNEGTVSMRLPSTLSSPSPVRLRSLGGNSEEEGRAFVDTIMPLRLRSVASSTEPRRLRSVASSTGMHGHAMSNRDHVEAEHSPGQHWQQQQAVSPVVFTGTSPASRLQSAHSNASDSGIRRPLSGGHSESSLSRLGLRRRGSQAMQDTPPSQTVLQETMVVRVESGLGISLFRAKVVPVNLQVDAGSPRCESGQGTARIARTKSTGSGFSKLQVHQIHRVRSMEAGPGAVQNRLATPPLGDSEGVSSPLSTRPRIHRSRSMPGIEELEAGLGQPVYSAVETLNLGSQAADSESNSHARHGGAAFRRASTSSSTRRHRARSMPEIDEPEAQVQAAARGQPATPVHSAVRRLQLESYAAESNRTASLDGVAPLTLASTISRAEEARPRPSSWGVMSAAIVSPWNKDSSPRPHSCRLALPEQEPELRSPPVPEMETPAPAGEAWAPRIGEWKRYLQNKASPWLTPLTALGHAGTRRASKVKRNDEPRTGLEPEVDWGRGKGAWYLTLEKHFREKSFGVRAKFESKDTIAAAVADTDYLHVFQTSYPIQAALCKWWFRQLSLVLFVAYIAAGSLETARMDERGGVEVKWVRFVSMQQRGDWDGNSSAVASVGAMGVWSHGCKSELVAEQRKDNEWVVQLEERSTVDGFFWHTSQKPADQDPVSFEILVSADGQEWEVAAASQRVLHISGHHGWSRGTFATPVQRNAQVDISFHPPWFMWLDPTVSNLVLACTWLGLYVCALGHQYRIAERRLESMGNGIDQWLLVGRRLFAAGFVVNAICLLVKTGALMRHRYLDHIVEETLQAMAAIVLAVCAAGFPKRSLKAFLFFACVKLAMFLIAAFKDHLESESLVIGLYFEAGAPSFIMILCTLLLLVQHARSKRASQLAVAQDSERYERAWEKIMNDDNEILGIDVLSAIEETIRETHFVQFPPVHLQRYHPMSRSTSDSDERWASNWLQTAQKRMMQGSSTRFVTRLRAFLPLKQRTPGLITRPRATGHWSRPVRSEPACDNPQRTGSEMVLSESFVSRQVVRRDLVNAWPGAAMAIEAQNPTEPGPIATRTPSTGMSQPEAAAAPSPSRATLPGLRKSSAVACSLVFNASAREPSLSASHDAQTASLRPEMMRCAAFLPAVPPLGEASLSPDTEQRMPVPVSTAGGGTSHIVTSSISDQRCSTCPEKHHDGESSPWIECEHGPSRHPSRAEGLKSCDRSLGRPLMRRQSLTGVPEAQDITGSSRERRFPSLDPAGSGARAVHQFRTARGRSASLTQPSSSILTSAESGAGQPRLKRIADMMLGRGHSSGGSGSGSQPGQAQSQSNLTLRTRNRPFSGSPLSRAASRSVSLAGLSRKGSTMNVFRQIMMGSSTETLFARSGLEKGDGELVESLDQLYAQAELLHPVLKMKVQRWAALSEGCFPRKGGGGKVAEWQYLVDRYGSEAAAEAEVKWASVKAVARAKEKLVRSYQGHPSRLLDLCRQSIIFKSTRTLAECLQHIADDPDVVLVSVKNRLHEEYDAKTMTLGYRDVNLSLRFNSSKTRQLGVDLHICEVQLLLEPFAKLKSADGHTRYIGWRNGQAR